LSATFGNRLCSPIHRATILRECAAEGVTIFEKDPTSRAAAEYKTLAEMILKF
jgi:chromosome partitioning protein